MSLRSLGATLLAKSNPGTALRNKEEQNIGGAVPAGNTSAQPNSAVRKTVDQPLEVSVPGGTEKNVAVKPTIQPNVSTTQPSTAAQGQGLLPQMGGGAAAAIAGRNINAPAAPVSGGGNVVSPNNVNSPSLSPTAQKASTSASSAGRVAKASVGNNAFLSNMGVGEKNAPAQTNTYNPVSTNFQLGTRASAAEGSNNEVGRSALQGVAATIANVIDKGVVNAVKNIGNVNNYQPTSKASQSLMNFASNPKASQSSGIISNIRSAASNAGQKVSNTVQKASSWLRSLFK